MDHRNYFLTAVLTSLLLSASPLANARQRVVNPSSGRCSDRGPGTAARPWCRLATAGRKARPGDKVSIRRGVYREQLKVVVSGTPGSPVEFAGEPGAILDGKGIALDEEGMIHVEDRRHVVVRGVTVKNSSFYCMKITGSNGVTVDRTVVAGCEHGGIVVDGGSSKIDITNNDVSRTDLAGVDDGIHEAITLSRTRDFLVAGNRVHHGVKEGIDAKDGSTRGVIRDNVIAYMGQVGIYLNHATRVRAFRNQVHHCGASGFQLAVGDHAEGRRETSRNEIFRNLVWANAYDGVEFWRAGGGVMKHNRIFNNVLVENGHSGIVLNHTSGNIIKNNIIAHNRHHGVSGSAVGASTLSNNLFFNNRWGKAVGTNSVTADPVFVAPRSGNFSLARSSPAYSWSFDREGES